MPYCQIEFFADVAMPDRQKGIHPGHSAVLFADPFANPFANPFADPFADLPEKPPLSRKVLFKTPRPSMKTAPSMEGALEKRMTFLENAL